MGTMYTNAMRSDTTRAQTGSSEGQTSMEMTANANMLRKMHAYHQSGTSRYLLMSRAWMSGISESERRD